MPTINGIKYPFIYMFLFSHKITTLSSLMSNLMHFFQKILQKFCPFKKNAYLCIAIQK